MRWLSVALLAISGQAAVAADQQTIGEAAGGLKMRSIGPAFMGGRIADIDVHPTRSSTWYVAVGSGGVWKTTNAGVTWAAVFEDESVYSIGDVTIDPNNGDIWVGGYEEGEELDLNAAVRAMVQAVSERPRPRRISERRRLPSIHSSSYG